MGQHLSCRSYDDERLRIYIHDTHKAIAVPMHILKYVFCFVILFTLTDASTTYKVTTNFPGTGKYYSCSCTSPTCTGSSSPATQWDNYRCGDPPCTDHHCDSQGSWPGGDCIANKLYAVLQCSITSCTTACSGGQYNPTCGVQLGVNNGIGVPCGSSSANATNSYCFPGKCATAPSPPPPPSPSPPPRANNVGGGPSTNDAADIYGSCPLNGLCVTTAANGVTNQEYNDGYKVLSIPVVNAAGAAFNAMRIDNRCCIPGVAAWSTSDSSAVSLVMLQNGKRYPGALNIPGLSAVSGFDDDNLYYNIPNGRNIYTCQFLNKPANTTSIAVADPAVAIDAANLQNPYQLAGFSQNQANLPLGASEIVSPSLPGTGSQFCAAGARLNGQPQNAYDCCSGGLNGHCKQRCINMYTSLDTADWYTCQDLTQPLRDITMPWGDLSWDGPRCSNSSLSLPPSPTTAVDCSGVPDLTTQIINILDSSGAPYPVLCVGKFVLLAKIWGTDPAGRQDPAAWAYDDPAWTTPNSNPYPVSPTNPLDLSFNNMRTDAYAKYPITGGLRLRMINTTTPTVTGVWRNAGLTVNGGTGISTALDLFSQIPSAGRRRLSSKQTKFSATDVAGFGCYDNGQCDGSCGTGCTCQQSAGPCTGVSGIQGFEWGCNCPTVSPPPPQSCSSISSGVQCTSTHGCCYFQPCPMCYPTCATCPPSPPPITSPPPLLIPPYPRYPVVGPPPPPYSPPPPPQPMSLYGNFMDFRKLVLMSRAPVSYYDVQTNSNQGRLHVGSSNQFIGIGPKLGNTPLDFFTLLLGAPLPPVPPPMPPSPPGVPAPPPAPFAPPPPPLSDAVSGALANVQSMVRLSSSTSGVKFGMAGGGKFTFHSIVVCNGACVPAPPPTAASPPPPTKAPPAVASPPPSTKPPPAAASPSPAAKPPPAAASPPPPATKSPPPALKSPPPKPPPSPPPMPPPLMTGSWTQCPFFQDVPLATNDYYSIHDPYTEPNEDYVPQMPHLPVNTSIDCLPVSLSAGQVSFELLKKLNQN